MEVTQILNQDYRPAPEWSRRNKNTGCFYRLKQKVKHLLICLSGNDICAMIKDILTSNELREVSSNYVIALKKMSKAVNDKTITKSKQKHYFIRPLRDSGLHLQEVKELGFKCSWDLWKSCKNSNARQLGGARKIPDKIIKEINKHMEGLSEIAANRSTKIIEYEKRNPVVLYKKKKKSERYVSAMYRQTTLQDSFKKFIEFSQTIEDELKIRRKNLKFSTFYKYVDKRFKKPFKLTDLCQYCEWGKEIKKEALSFNQRFFNNQFNREYKSDLLVNFYKIKKDEVQVTQNNDLLIQIDAKINEMENLKTIEFHRSIVKSQRCAYNTHRHDVDELNGKILIEMDFKQKIILGEGPRQLNEEWFNKIKKQVVLLGFGIYFVQSKKQNESIESNSEEETDGLEDADLLEFKFVNCLNIDVVTDYEGMTSSDLIRIFKHIMNLNEFKKIDQDNYIIWTDCGTQFRSSEFIYFLMNELPMVNKSVNLNFFAEKHGIF